MYRPEEVVISADVKVQREEKITAIQAALRERGLDGWLFYSFHGSDPLAATILLLEAEGIQTRRWFYYIPASGTPHKLVHRIESGALDGLPGKKRVYLPWQQLQGHLKEILSGSRRIAMQYSPNNDIPYVSWVDGGTLERIRGYGLEVVSSAELVQLFEARWTERQLDQHRRAARRLHEMVQAGFGQVRAAHADGRELTEGGLQRFLLEQMDRVGLVRSDDPIVAYGPHAGDPHYGTPSEGGAVIQPGNVLLLDIWGHVNETEAVFADITWMGYVGRTVPQEPARVFNVAAAARVLALEAIQKASAAGRTIHGWEVDQAARRHVESQGLGEFFVHRTGHSLGRTVHGAGANMDGLESHDVRPLIPRTAFTLEPGIYMPEFGVRTEINVYMSEAGPEVTTQPVQEGMVALLA